MKTFERLGFNELCDRLALPARTLLLMHRSPDADTLGSCLSLATLLEAAESTVYCACGDAFPENLDFLTKGQRFLDMPEDFRPERVITVDVASPEQLGSLRETYEGRIDLMIDHHERGTPMADHYVDPHAAATGEIIFDIAKEFISDRVVCRIPEPFWEYCYAAISSDTGCFRYANTTAATLRRAAAIMEHGIDTASINHRLFFQKPFSQLRAESIGVDRLRLYADGRIGIISIPYATIREHGFSDGDLNTLVDVARSVRGVQIAAVIKQKTAAPEFRVSLRASVNVNVATVAGTFGGGGHDRAAGCTVCADSIEAAERLIADALEAALRDA